jgi:FixJ family two-component response regulator
VQVSSEEKTGAVQVQGLGLNLYGWAKPATATKGRFRDPLIQVAAMSDADSTVLIIDDDADLRASVGRLLRSLGIDVQLFVSIADFLKSNPPDGPTCLVLDVRLPGQSGLDLQRELASANRKLPIIFITGYGDIPMSVEAMKGGAIEFLTKPFRDQDLLDAIQLGLARDRSLRKEEKDLTALRERFGSLSPREREIVGQVVRGRLSKQIAHDIGIAEATVKVHRSRAMQKMKAGSLPELGRMADKLKLVSEESQRS